MNWPKIVAVLLLVMAYPLLFLNASAQRFNQEKLQRAQTVPEETDVRRITLRDGSVREYSLYAPSLRAKQRVPLLLVFHGGGGPFTSRQKVTNMKNATKFDQIADRERFVVVYPLGYGPHWNDERPEMKRTNDLEFIDTLIGELTKMPNIDSARVYATGISNGGFFVNYLGLRLSDKIAAIASLCGPIPTVDASLRPIRPVSALIIDGTGDAKIPFSGGGINGGVSGQTLSHNDSVGYWISVNGGATKTLTQTTVPSPAGGNSQVSVWQTKSGALVGSVIIAGGAHQWYNARNANFDASEFIWSFFKNQYKEKSH
jgi:polyhydroxybutyrate depolymerase